MKELECNIDPILNPEHDRYHTLKSNSVHSYRGIIKFEIDKSLTKYILNTLRSRKNYFDIPITFEEMYPDDFSFYQNLMHYLIKDDKCILECDPLRDKDMWS